MAAIVEGRSCEGCTMCCKIMGIPEIDKAPLTWCRHCEIGVGCRIYEKRPDVCRNFYCRYMLTPSLAEHWKPSNCNMLLTFDKSSKTLAIRVDPDHADAWRQEPYLSEIKGWAAVAWHDNGQVIVWQGDVAIAMLPHGEKVLGPVREDQGILRTTVQGPTGKMFDAKVVDKPRF